MAGTAVAAALQLLRSQVAAEGDGTAIATLAKMVLSAATGATPTDEEEALLVPSAILYFARFDSQQRFEP